MIQILGMRRIAILTVLIAVNAVLAPLAYMYILPQNQRLESELQGLQGQVRQKSAEAERLRGEFATIQDQKALFENIKAAGFLSDQSRAVVRRRVEEIQKFTHILRAGYEVAAAEIEKFDEATRAGYMVLESPLTIDIEALDDVDIYNFIYWIEMTMPGHVALENLTLERNFTVNEGTLRNIGNGIPTVMVKGQMKVAWRTMVPDTQSSGEGVLQ